MAGFEFMYRMSGAGPTVKNLLLTGKSVKKGDLVSLTAGTIYPSGTTDTNLTGVAIGAATGGAGVRVPVIVDPDAVYAVTDANVRKVGDCLDVSGASGAQGVHVGVAKQFVVAEDKTAAEKSKVRFNLGMHTYLLKQ